MKNTIHYMGIFFDPDTEDFLRTLAETPLAKPTRVLHVKWKRGGAS